MAVGIPRERSWMLRTAEKFTVTCLQCARLKSATYAVSSLKILCIKTPAEAQPVLLRRHEVLDHTGRTSVTFGEKFATSFVMLTWESGSAGYCIKYFWGAFAPEF